MRKGEKMGLNKERDTEILRLRFDEKVSIGVIAKRYNISKQRVQQIVGKTGHWATIPGRPAIV